MTRKLSAFLTSVALLSITLTLSSQETPESTVPSTAPVDATPASPVPETSPAPTPTAPAAAHANIGMPEFVGSETCLACHGDKKDYGASHHIKNLTINKKIAADRTCETCHGPGSLHADAAGDKTNAGFHSIKAFLKVTAREANATCLECHSKGGQTHWQGSAHDSHNVSCVKCHSVHSGFSHELIKPQVTEVCASCHKDVQAKIQRNSHHPIKEGKMHCADCHNPHGTVGPSLLTANTVNETCYKCHAEKRGPFLFEHRPVSEDCTVCHMPHGSNHDKLLAQRQPFLCQSCHSISRHPGTTYAENPATAGSTTFQKLSNRAYYRGCANCHQQVHGSNHPSGAFLLR